MRAGPTEAMLLSFLGVVASRVANRMSVRSDVSCAHAFGDLVNHPWLLTSGECKQIVRFSPRHERLSPSTWGWHAPSGASRFEPRSSQRRDGRAILDVRRRQ